MGWDSVPLPEVADYDLGKMLDKVKNKGNLRPYLANLDVRWGEFDLTSLREMRFKDTEIDRYSLQYGDIVMCEGGEPGRCAFWKNEIPEMMFQKALHRIRANERIEAKFLYYALYDLAYRRQIDGLFTGATIKHLPKGQLAFINVPLPPLPIQRRIAGILSAYDDLIEVNTRRIKALEEMARRTYEDWLDVQHQIPKAKLIEIADLTMGQSPKSEFYNDSKDGLPFHQGVTNFGELYPTHKLYSTAGKRQAEEGDILFSVRAPVGRINIAPSKMILGRGLAAIRSKRDAQAFLLSALKHEFSEEDKIGNGAIFKAVTKADMQDIELPNPANSILSEAEKVFRGYWTLIGNLVNQNANLRAQRDLLLPRLVSGAIDVSDAEATLQAAAE